MTGWLCFVNVEHSADVTGWLCFVSVEHSADVTGWLCFVSVEHSADDRLVVFQLIRSLERAYVISAANRDDINKLLKSLGTVRSLLSVQVCSDEEEILKNSIWSVLTVTDLYIIWPVA